MRNLKRLRRRTGSKVLTQSLRKDVYKRQDLSMCDGGRWLWEMDDSKLAQYNEKEKKLS